MLVKKNERHSKRNVLIRKETYLLIPTLSHLLRAIEENVLRILFDMGYSFEENLFWTCKLGAKIVKFVFTSHVDILDGDPFYGLFVAIR